MIHTARSTRYVRRDKDFPESLASWRNPHFDWPDRSDDEDGRAAPGAPAAPGEEERAECPAGVKDRGEGDRLPELPPGTNPKQLAAWTIVSRVLLNLDETLTKN